jgi:hypothetical protein
MDKLYSAVLAGKNTVNVFDVRKGIKSYSISLGNVEVVNGPIVTQNKMTIVVKDQSGSLRGKVYSLPKGILSYSFQVK